MACGMDGPGIEFRWGVNFGGRSRSASMTIKFPVRVVPGVSGLKGPESGVNHLPHSWAGLRMCRVVPLFNHCAYMDMSGCKICFCLLTEA